MSSQKSDIADRLWHESKTLQGAGVSILHYVNELTYLLFLKMLEETDLSTTIPEKYNWSMLSNLDGSEQLQYYRTLLLELGNPRIVKNTMVLAIFSDATTHLRKPKDLKKLTTSIDQVDWFSVRKDGLGDLYEGLMEKVMSDKKATAGQYFTPRPLIDCIIRLTKPEPGEVIQDPAAGTGGFLIAADRYIKDKTDELFDLKNEERILFQRKKAYCGHEYVPDTHRLCVMNMLLHGVENCIGCEDSCSSQGEHLPKADIILTNPPFNKMTGNVSRSDFTLTASEKIGPLPFVEHAVRKLKTGGRCAIVVPDNILFGEGTAARLRKFLMVNCNLHTILRLPTGIFYAQGVKANVLFFTRKTRQIYPIDRAEQATKEVWFYDMRTNMKSFGKRSPLSASDFESFEFLYGANSMGLSKRFESGEDNRWRRLTRAEISEQHGGRLDWTWLQAALEVEENEFLSSDAILKKIRKNIDTVSGIFEQIGIDLAKGTK